MWETDPLILRCLKIAAVGLLILLPVMLYGLYALWTAPPKSLVLAAGTTDGLYHDVGRRLAAQIQQKLHISVTLVETDGSWDNLQRVQSGEADLCFYQPQTWEILKPQKTPASQPAGSAGESSENRPGRPISTVANLYSQPVHLIVRRNAGVESTADLVGKTISRGLPNSGDYAISKLVLPELGLSEADLHTRHLPYQQLPEAFQNEQLDAAIICLGVQAPILQRLFATGQCKLMTLPNPDALCLRHWSLTKFVIPRGTYRATPPEPAEDLVTVAAQAQLLARADLSARVTTQITQLVLSPEFLKENELVELFDQGRDFARRWPEFPVHSGARTVYAPDFELDHLQSWEAAYSLVASLLIGGLIALQWVHKKRTLSREHKMDQYIRRLLNLERQQLPLDDHANRGKDKHLQDLLDELTFLRQEALSTFTAHELNEDRAAECFIHMCHALSNKINAKLTRQRTDTQLGRLLQIMERALQTAPAASPTAAQQSPQENRSTPNASFNKRVFRGTPLRPTSFQKSQLNTSCLWSPALAVSDNSG